MKITDIEFLVAETNRTPFLSPIARTSHAWDSPPAAIYSYQLMKMAKLFSPMSLVEYLYITSLSAQSLRHLHFRHLGAILLWALAA